MKVPHVFVIISSRHLIQAYNITMSCPNIYLSYTDYRAPSQLILFLDLSSRFLTNMLALYTSATNTSCICRLSPCSRSTRKAPPKWSFCTVPSNIRCPRSNYRPWCWPWLLAALSLARAILVVFDCSLYNLASQRTSFDNFKILQISIPAQRSFIILKS